MQVLTKFSLLGFELYFSFVFVVDVVFFVGGWGWGGGMGGGVGGVLSDISRLPNNTSMFVLLCVFGGRDLCFGCNCNLG